ncbi:hypothetical protein J6590_005861 [Homalodisca vitripennis]|nr:hypothetical protein J6590_005861 [Homalodisca vitripennis]
MVTARDTGNVLIVDGFDHYTWSNVGIAVAVATATARKELQWPGSTTRRHDIAPNRASQEECIIRDPAVAVAVRPRLAGYRGHPQSRCTALRV